MGRPIQDIEGIGRVMAEKLGAAEITNTDQLLERGSTPEGRKQIAEVAGIGRAKILKWVNMADLFRIRGVGSEFAELLESAGVDTVSELATRRADNLAARMAEVNERRKLTRRVPSVDLVTGWVDQARALPRKVEH